MKGEHYEVGMLVWVAEITLAGRRVTAKADVARENELSMKTRGKGPEMPSGRRQITG